MTIILHVTTRAHEEYRGQKRYIRIIIHETRAQLKKAAGYLPEANVAGCYQPPNHIEKFDTKNKKWNNTTRKYWGGVIRMSLEDLSTDVVVHESFHASATIFRMDIYPAISIGKECNYKEEHLAYLVGDISASIFDVLYDNGVWKAKDEFDKQRIL